MRSQLPLRSNRPALAAQGGDDEAWLHRRSWLHLDRALSHGGISPSVYRPAFLMRIRLQSVITRLN
jgi:hypothetical protein